MRYDILRLALVAALLGGTAGCDRLAEPVDGSELIFIRQSPSSPPLVSDHVTFWAKRGETVEVRLPYTNGHECLRFKVPNNALLAYPDGRRFAEGDSVQITIRQVDASLYNFEFQPAGLRFAADHPAELRVEYSYRDLDTDHDGDVDDADRTTFNAARFWRQELPGEPWRAMGTVRIDEDREMRAELLGFTRYALASN